MLLLVFKVYAIVKAGKPGFSQNLCKKFFFVSSSIAHIFFCSIVIALRFQTLNISSFSFQTIFMFSYLRVCVKNTNTMKHSGFWRLHYSNCFFGQLFYNEILKYQYLQSALSSHDHKKKVKYFKFHPKQQILAVDHELKKIISSTSEKILREKLANKFWLVEIVNCPTSNQFLNTLNQHFTSI